MEDRDIGSAFLFEDAQHIGVCLPIVDLQGASGALGDLDMGAEGALLFGEALLCRAEVVETGLPHHAHAIVRAHE